MFTITWQGVRKDQLIKMILENSHPATAPDTTHLTAPAFFTANTNHTDNAYSLLRLDTATSLRPDQALVQLPVSAQPALDDSTCSLVPDTALEPLPNTPPQRAGNMGNTQPQSSDAAQPLSTNDTHPINE